MIYKLNENKPKFPEDGDFWVAPDANVIGKIRLMALALRSGLARRCAGIMSGLT